MKTKLFITLIVVFGAMGLKAQGVKIGYTNTQYILTLMPEAKQIQSERSVAARRKLVVYHQSGRR